MQTAVAPRIVVFYTEEELHDHAEKLNQIGVSPDVPIMDSRGIACLASRTAPGGDGWGFEYYMPADDGFMHCCNCGEHRPVDCPVRTPDWKPFFPVTGLVCYDLTGVEGIYT